MDLSGSAGAAHRDGLLAMAAFVAGLLPDVGRTVEAAVIRFQDQAAYNSPCYPESRHAPGHPASRAGRRRDHRERGDRDRRCQRFAAAGLARAVLPVLRSLIRSHDGLVRMSRGFQSGVINDYVTWIVVGLACVGGTLAFAIR